MAAYTYPGVYIEEISSGQHTITGVATSIAAFIGWSNQGPVGAPIMVESWPQYQAIFGGMIPGNYLGYAVYQFFLNGGSQAYIVRLVWTDAVAASNDIVGLQLYASNPGAWANRLNVVVSNVNTTKHTFNLQVTKVNGAQAQTLESYTNLSSLSTSPQFAVTVINSDSSYITFTPPSGTAPTSITLPSGSTPAATLTTPAGTTLNGGTSLTTGFDGTQLIPSSSDTGGDFETQLTGVDGYQLLSNIPIFNLLCVPGETSTSVLGNLEQFCHQNRAFLIIDSPQTSASVLTAVSAQSTGPVDSSSTSLTSGQYTSNSAFYFPWVLAPDPQVGYRPALFPPCGFVAGIYASTDASRGVWKAPAGIHASLTGALGLQYVLTDMQNGALNEVGVNCLRQFHTYGDVVWGARTMAGADAAGSDWKYIPIRRLALFIESSLYEGTQWAVFEPNAEPLWGQVRMSIGSFMQGLFLQGAFAGITPHQAYFVKCDRDNNPDSSVSMGILNITVGFAPLYPAEFVVIEIQQMINRS